MSRKPYSRVNQSASRKRNALAKRTGKPAPKVKAKRASKPVEPTPAPALASTTGQFKTSTLRPGLLVSLKTTLKGNVDYDKVDLEKEHKTREGAMKAKWETTRLIADPAEFEVAQKARSKASSLVRAICSPTSFGLLCPEDRTKQLQTAIADAHAVIDGFNATAKITHLGFYVIGGRVAQDDVEAVRAINSEVRDLFKEMSAGIKALDVEQIRQAANKARGLGQMLSPDAQARVQIAIDTARKVARNINKAGDDATVTIDDAAIKKITEQRTAFLDLDGGDSVKAVAAEGRAVDLVSHEVAEANIAATKPRVERARVLEVE